MSTGRLVLFNSIFAAAFLAAGCERLMVAPITAPTAAIAAAARTSSINDQHLMYRVRLLDERGNPMDGVTVTIMRHRYVPTGDVNGIFESAAKGAIIVKNNCFDRITVDKDVIADGSFAFKSSKGIAAVSVSYSKPGYRRQLYVYNRGGNPRASWLELPRSPDRWVDVSKHAHSDVNMVPEDADARDAVITGSSLH
jgi:hypothetical protein